MVSSSGYMQGPPQADIFVSATGLSGAQLFSATDCRITPRAAGQSGQGAAAGQTIVDTLGDVRGACGKIEVTCLKI